MSPSHLHERSGEKTAKPLGWTRISEGVAAVRKGVLLGLVFLITLIASVETRAASEPDLSYLKGWVGEYPQVLLQKKVNGASRHEKDLWQDPNVSKSLSQSLGEPRFKQLVSGWGTGNPRVSLVSQEGDNIAFFACKQHDCYENQAVVFIHLETGATRVCWRDGIETTRHGVMTKDFWFLGDGKAKKLASEACGVEPLSRLLGMQDVPVRKPWPWEKWLKK